MKYRRYLLVDSFWYFLLGGIIIVVDQATKHWAFSVGHAGCRSFCFELIPVINYGIALSIASSNRAFIQIMLILLITSFLFFFTWYAHWKHYHGRPIFVEACILGAGISNLLDRFFYGGVLDFIAINIVPSLSLPVGNLADIVIVVGLIYLCYQLFTTLHENVEQEW